MMSQASAFTATTTDLQRVLRRSESSVRGLSLMLPMESVSEPRVPRQWTLRDTLSLLIADALMNSGLSQPVALRLTSLMVPAFERAILEEKTPVYLVAWPSSTAPAGWAGETAAGADATYLMQREGIAQCQLFSVTGLVREALIRWREAQLAEDGHD